MSILILANTNYAFGRTLLEEGNNTSLGIVSKISIVSRGVEGSKNYKKYSEENIETTELNFSSSYLSKNTDNSLSLTRTSFSSLKPNEWEFVLEEPTLIGDGHSLLWDNAYSGIVFFNGIVGDPDFFITNNTCDNGRAWECKIEFGFFPLEEGPRSTTLSIIIWNDADGDGVISKTTLYLYVKASGIISDWPPEIKKKYCGSDVNIDGRSVNERVDVTGCGIDLVYSSDRSPDYWTNYQNAVRLNPFNPEGWSISKLHYYNKAENNLFLGSGAYLPRKHSVLSDGNVMVVNEGEVFIFDPSGKHLETRSALTNALIERFIYTNDNKILKIIDADGLVVTFNRNNDGTLASIVSPYGEVTTIGVEENGRISSITNPNNESYQMTYDPSGDDFLHTFSKPSGLTSQLEYDGPGYLRRDTGAGGNFWDLTFEIEDTAHKTQLTTALGRNTTFVTDRDEETGLYTRIEKSPADFVSTYTEGNDRSKIFSNPFETTTIQTVQDERFGELNLRTSSSSTTIEGITRTVEYLQSADLSDPNDPFSYSELVNTLRINGIDTVSTFNKASMMSTVVDPAGVATKMQLDSKERPTSIQLGNDIPLSIVYNSAGQVSSTAQGDQAQTSYVYDSRGNLQSVTNALGQKTSYEYDLANRPIRIIANDGSSVEMEYNADGKVTGIKPSARPMHLFSYNLLDLTESYTPPLLPEVVAPATTYDYNLDKQLTGINRPDGQSIELIYNENSGLLESMGNQTYTYIPESELVKTISSTDGVVSEFSHFGTSQIASEKQSYNAQDSEVLFSFDNFFRPFKRVIKLGENIVGEIVTVFRDDGKPSQIGAMNLSYDQTSGRLSQTQLDNIKDYRSYDAYGNLESYQAVVVVNGQEETLYSYSLERDVLQRIVAKEEMLNGITDRYEYSFDGQGRLTTVSKNGEVYSSYVHDLAGNIVSGMMNGTNFNAVYDEQDRLISWTEAASTMLMATTSSVSTQSSSLFSASSKKNSKAKNDYKHDKKHQKYKKVRKLVKKFFGHLKHHKHKHFKPKHCIEDRHDRGKHLGWFKHKHKKHHKHHNHDCDDDDNGGGDNGGGDNGGGDGDYGEPGAPLPLDGAGSYAYNANGELISIAQGEAISSYEVDEFGRLKGATLADGTQISYVLDWDGRRVAKLVNGEQVYRRIYSSHLQLAAEVKADGTVSEFVFGTSVNSADYMKQGSSHYRMIHDHLGSPRLVVNSLDGTIMQRLDYNEWGNVIADTNPSFQPFGFAGGLYDADTKLVKFGARDYSASVARWSSKDPILFAGGDTNLYRYVVGDPVNYFDPEGLNGESLAKRFIRNVIGTIRKGFRFFKQLRENIEKKIKEVDPSRSDEDIDESHGFPEDYTEEAEEDLEKESNVCLDISTNDVLRFLAW